MRVVIVTGSYPPDVNRVAHCAARTAAHLVRRGHDPLVVAPAPARADRRGTPTAAARRPVRRPS